MASGRDASDARLPARPHGVDGAFETVVPSQSRASARRADTKVEVSMAGDDRLQAVKDDLDSVLSDRIGRLMGLVSASKDLVTQIGDADRQIRAEGAQRDIAEQRGDAASAEELEHNLTVLRALRESLVDRLAAISVSAR